MGAESHAGLSLECGEATEGNTDTRPGWALTNSSPVTAVLGGSPAWHVPPTSIRRALTIAHPANPLPNPALAKLPKGVIAKKFPLAATHKKGLSFPKNIMFKRKHMKQPYIFPALGDLV